jgi:hypothetical protein
VSGKGHRRSGEDHRLRPHMSRKGKGQYVDRQNSLGCRGTTYPHTKRFVVIILGQEFRYSHIQRFRLLLSFVDLQTVRLLDLPGGI